MFSAVRLTGLLEGVATTKKGKAMNHMEAVARRKVGGAAEWEYCRWERIGEGRDMIVEGGIPRLLKSGPLKGQKTWQGQPTQKAVVTGAEIDAEHARYEAETGKCGDCGGKWQVFARWSKANGTETKTCPRCGGTGEKPSNAVIEPRDACGSSDRMES